MSYKPVELHFIDGPLQGTRKMEDAIEISRNRTYRVLQPTNIHPQVTVPNNTNNTWVQVTCIEYRYLPFKLPSLRNGPERYAMCLEGELY